MVMEWSGAQMHPMAVMSTASMVVKYVVALVPQNVHDAKPSDIG